MFDPAVFVTFSDSTGIARSDLFPCPCGNPVFTRLHDIATGRNRTVCLRCIEGTRGKDRRRETERTAATVDTRNGRVTEL
jgi:hypothetical protein